MRFLVRTTGEGNEEHHTADQSRDALHEIIVPQLCVATEPNLRVSLAAGTVVVVREPTDAEMRSTVAQLVSESDDAKRVDGWLAVNDDVLRQFRVTSTSPGDHGPNVMLPAPDPDVEQRMRTRYGDGTTFQYGVAYAPLALPVDPEKEH